MTWNFQRCSASASPLGDSVPGISFMHINDKSDSVKQNSVLLYTSCLFGDILNDICAPGKGFKQKHLLFRLIYGWEWLSQLARKASKKLVRVSKKEGCSQVKMNLESPLAKEGH